MLSDKCYGDQIFVTDSVVYVSGYDINYQTASIRSLVFNNKLKHVLNDGGKGKAKGAGIQVVEKD